jgi:hypothetical protein
MMFASDAPPAGHLAAWPSYIETASRQYGGRKDEFWIEKIKLEGRKCGSLWHQLVSSSINDETL